MRNTLLFVMTILSGQAGTAAAQSLPLRSATFTIAPVIADDRAAARLCPPTCPQGTVWAGEWANKFGNKEGTCTCATQEEIDYAKARVAEKKIAAAKRANDVAAENAARQLFMLSRQPGEYDFYTQLGGAKTAAQKCPMMCPVPLQWNLKWYDDPRRGKGVCGCGTKEEAARALQEQAAAAAKRADETDERKWGYWTPARCKAHCNNKTSGLCWDRCLGAPTFEEMGKAQDACIARERGVEGNWDGGTFKYIEVFKRCGIEVSGGR